jgi:hypothetical protein
MTLVEWIRAYGREKEKEIRKIFDSNGEAMFYDP